MQEVSENMTHRGNIIQEFEMELADEYIYRIYKYDLADFYFESSRNIWRILSKIKVSSI